MTKIPATLTVTMTVNDAVVTAEVEPRLLLVDFLRDHLGLTGTHVGCDTSQCGACVAHVNGRSVKTCAMLAVQADGARVTTIEGVAEGDRLHPMQAAFREHHGLQCGFCTPGMVMSALDLAARDPAPDAETIRTWLKGNLCRCTGYQSIVAAIAAGARAMAAGGRG
jgi:aerobic carbon-monoxide dehydrogenase small subunit